jgi:drug/metabolite transporter (DMT)-like permease
MIATVLCALFAFAYGESIMRGIRQQRRRPTPSEFLGLVGAGAVAGLAVALAAWTIRDRLIMGWVALVIIVCVSAAVAVSGYAFQRRSDTARVTQTRR